MENVMTKPLVAGNPGKIYIWLAVLGIYIVTITAATAF